MAVVDYLLHYYKFPFEFREDQRNTIETLAPFDRTGLFLDVGLGKTCVSTALFLYAGLIGVTDQAFLLVPPILVGQWNDWLKNFPDLDVKIYRGTPAKRKAMSLEADVLITTPGLFKNDYDRLMEFYRERHATMIIDEATIVRRPNTDNFRAIWDYMQLPNKRLQLLTGTPVGNNPVNAYGYIRLKSPEVYRDLRQFYVIHVRGEDQFHTPNRFANLDLLRDNLMIQSVALQADDVLDLPEVQYIPFRYDLSPAHRKIYDKLVDDMLLVFENGEMIDASTQQKLYVKAQQILLALPEGAGVTPSAFEVVDEIIEETGLLRKTDEKLIIFTNFQASNDAVFAYLQKVPGINPVQVYGGQSMTKNNENVEKLKNDPNTKVAVCNPVSGGVGLNYQDVCRYQLFLETPITSDRFIQAVGRIKRTGQKRQCTVWLAVARGTCQERIQRSILSKEDVVSQVYQSKITLRSALTGG